MILFSSNLNVPVTGSGFQPIATVPLSAGLLLSGVLRYSLNGRRSSGAGSSQQRVRIGGVDLLTPSSGDASANIYLRGTASAENAINLRANAATSRGGATQLTGLTNVDLSLALDLTFEIDLSVDADVYTFDDLTVEYLPSP